MQPLKVCVEAYYGGVRCENNKFVSEKLTAEYDIEYVVNHPFETTFKLSNNLPLQYGVDELLHEFERKNCCKVVLEECIDDVVFNIFEPNFLSSDMAQAQICALMDELIPWMKGYPSV